MRTLILDSDIWILDEPFSALDDETKEILFETFVRAIKQNKAIIVTGHSTIKHNLINVKNYLLEDGRIQ